jgi:Domain of unknown function (DUF4429)
MAVTGMSDTSQGEGWWLASDGKWYPPELRSEPARQATVDASESDSEAGDSPRLADIEATPESGGEELSAEGSNGVLSIEGADLVIRRGGIMALGREKERRLPLTSISGVRVVGPSLIQQGYLRVLLNGLDSPPLKPTTAASDDNSVLFGQKHAETFRRLEHRLQEIATENRKNGLFPEPVQAQAATPLEPVLRFKSHIEGKNADVAVWPDRIEWGQNIASTPQQASCAPKTYSTALTLPIFSVADRR